MRDDSEPTGYSSRLEYSFTPIPNELLESGISPHTFRVYTQILHLTRRKDGRAYQSVSNMAKACAMSNRKVHECLAELESIHLIVGMRVPGKPTDYIVTDVPEWKLTSAPHAEGGLHHMQRGSAPHADKEERDNKKEKGRTKSLSRDDQIEVALRHSDSPEAQAFLAANGISTDKRPEWDLRKALKKTLGDDFKHPQVQANLESWVGRITALDIRNAHTQAVARYQREPRPSKLRPIHFFVDILNGTYKPDAHEIAELEAEQAAVKAAVVAAAPKSGDRVQLPDGTISIVHEYLPAGDWVVLTDRDETFRPQEVKVIT